MSNIFVNETLIAKKALQRFDNNLVLAKTVNRQFQDTFSNNSGTTVKIRQPSFFNTTSGADATGQIQDIQETTTDLTINRFRKVVTSLTSQQLALNMDDFDREVITPAMESLANTVDADIYDSSLGFYNAVGTAGTAPNTYAIVNNARTLLTSQGVRLRPRYACFNVIDGGSLATGLQSQFNYSDFNKGLLKDGYIGDLCGFAMHQVQNTVQSRLASGAIGTPLINGSVSSGATTLAADGITSGITIYKGAVFTIAGVGAVNPATRRGTGLPQQFVVTADVVATGGSATIPISPSIIYDGTPLTNVTALPVNDAALTFNASHTVNIAYHPEAFTLAMVKLDSPEGAGAKAKTVFDEKAGISIRMVTQYDAITDVWILRFDCLYGIQCFPRYGARVMGSYNSSL